MSEIIQGILPKTDAVDILVGYFFFSGYYLLSQGLANKKLRILVGLDVDTNSSKSIQVINTLSENKLSLGQLREKYYLEFVHLFNNSDFLDSEEKQKSFTLFYNKIKDGSLEIRKTEEPCHAKMYIFDYDDIHNEQGEDPGNVITGSSNLSYQGLEGRTEINVRLKDKQNHIDAKKIFNELWEMSVPVVDQDTLPAWEDKVIKHIWYEKLYAPYLMYIRVLYEYFNIPSKDNILTPYDITEGRYTNLKYQTDAVQLALNAIYNHNGVIIADVVGLGKSIIASTIARNLRLRTIIVAPPHLVRQWEVYKDEFGFNASVFSAGKIETALNHFKEIARSGEQFLIIIDEAHRFRNEYIKDYSLLHDLCSNNKVVLLTATPFNNRPNDIYSLLKLFQIPNKSTLRTVENLGESFRELIATYKDMEKAKREKRMTDEEIKKEAERIASSIRSIINPLVVRRSRIDLMEIPVYKEDLHIQSIMPVIPDDPQELNYELSESQLKLYLRTLDLIAESEHNDDGITRFKSARYQPVAYAIKEKIEELTKYLEKRTGVEYRMLVGRQKNVSSFMRKLLVQRFESSVYAFRQSLGFMIQSAENLLTWIEKSGEIPVFKKGGLPDVEDFYEITDDGVKEIYDAFELYEQKGLFTIPRRFISEEFMEDVKSDIALLKKIREEWFGADDSIKFDPKLDEFKRILSEHRKKDPKRKIVVFSAFADTVDYLGETLQKAGNPLRVMKYTSGDASSSNKEKIRSNFDAGVRKELQQDDYDILIATDAISEGYNLHRAGEIFNYDIPYNPTRVIQRIGRINRINKKVFEHLHIFNFFPTEVGEAETRTKEISTLKMAMIHAIMGEDTKALTKDEEVQSFFAERYRRELSKTETASWDTPYRRLLDQLKGTDLYKEALLIPHRARIARHTGKPRYGVMMFGKKGNDFVFKIASGNEITMLSAEEALSLFEAQQNEPPFAVDESFDASYPFLKSKLFSGVDKQRRDPRLLEALAKIKLIRESNILDKAYVDDLLTVAQADGLSGYEVRHLTNIKKNEIVELPKLISHAYLLRKLETMASVESGEESLILTEQILPDNGI